MKNSGWAAIAGVIGLILLVGLAQKALTPGSQTVGVANALGNDLTQFVYVSQGNKPAQL